LNYEILGESFQAVQITLDSGEAVQAEPGALLFMEEGIEMETTSRGIFGGLKRIFSRESFFLTIFRNTTDVPLSVCFAAPYPGTIIPIELEESSILCKRGAFLCSSLSVEISVAVQRKPLSGMKGADGFILQKLSGTGTAFIHAAGSVIERELGEGEGIRVDPDSLVAFTEEVRHDLTLLGGIKNALFGGEGPFLLKLKGPGRVYLQTLPLRRLRQVLFPPELRKK